MVRLIADAGADVNGMDEGWRPLARAAFRGHVEVVRTLLERGACPSLESHGKASIEHARDAGHADVVALLESHVLSAAPATPVAVHDARASTLAAE